MDKEQEITNAQAEPQEEVVQDDTIVEEKTLVEDDSNNKGDEIPETNSEKAKRMLTKRLGNDVMFVITEVTTGQHRYVMDFETFIRNAKIEDVKPAEEQEQEPTAAAPEPAEEEEPEPDGVEDGEDEDPDDEDDVDEDE